MKVEVAKRVINRWLTAELDNLQKEYNDRVDETEIVYAVMEQCIREGIDRELRDPDEIREDLKLVANYLDKESKFATLMNHYRGLW